LHGISPAPQVAEQTPWVQNGAAASQTWPQVPQLVPLVFTSVHTPPQSCAVPKQTQEPPEQVRVASHFVPHAPQFALSVFTSVHFVPVAVPCAKQLMRPVGQVDD
jgi:hypothetical protein